MIAVEKKCNWKLLQYLLAGNDSRFQIFIKSFKLIIA